MYTKCVEANKCDPPDSKSSQTHPSYFDNPEFAEYPVIYVSWNDALAYCSWVGRTLPTEAEWEKAARGTEGGIYPWGNISPKNALLNYSDSYYGDTTKVGTFPEGASVYGVLDMAGNVWEWVSSQYQPYPYYENDGREYLNSTVSKALRGGAWNNNGNGVRSALRGGFLPIITSNNLGFRCGINTTP
jgi:formylglycine-generating enzyme required for sulfatase activity